MSSPSPSRIRGTIRAALVGDAAALGVHWIYDSSKVMAMSPMLFRTPAADHYHKARASGEHTHHGDTALMLLRSLQASGGTFSHKAYGQYIQGSLSSGYKGYLDHATRAFLKSHTDATASGAPYDFQSGAADTQMVSIAGLPVLVSVYAAGPVAAQDAAVAAYTRVRQNESTTVAYAIVYGRMLRAALCGADAAGVVAAGRAAAAEAGREAIAQHFDTAAARAHNTTPLDMAVQSGLSCGLASGFPIVVHALIRLSETADFESVLTQIIAPGGDNASRAILVAALWGALHGEDAIPAALWERVAAHAEVDAALATLVPVWAPAS